MKLFGKDVTTQKLLGLVKERLAARGLSMPSEDAGLGEVPEQAIDAFAFAIDAMGEHVDSTRGLPIETHRDGLGGRAVVLAKQLFRSAGQLFINEALARQVSFNGHVRDGFAQLSAEVLRLRDRVEELEAQLAEERARAKQPVLSTKTTTPPKKAAPKAPKKPRAR